jgi:hypothetical protein
MAHERGELGKFRRIEYRNLNSRQQENYNFAKLSAVLADYGYTTIRLSDDWQGADLIAQHIDGATFLPVQLKGRLHFMKGYQGKGLWVAFCEKGCWYLFPHDELLKQVLKITRISSTVSWRQRGGYSWPRIPKMLQSILSKYRLD